MSGGKIKEIIAELSRIKMKLKMKIVDICGFRILCVCAVNGVMQEIIANFMYEQDIHLLKGVNLPYRQKLMPNTSCLVLQKEAKSGGV